MLMFMKKSKSVVLLEIVNYLEWMETLPLGEKIQILSVVVKPGSPKTPSIDIINR